MERWDRFMAIDRVLDSRSPTIEKPMSSVSVAQGRPPGRPPRRRPLFAYLVLGMIALWVGPAAAHTADKNMRRTFVIERVDAGLLLYVRSPGPFIFGDAIAEMLGTGKQIESPFVRLERSFQRIGYRLQRKAKKSVSAGDWHARSWSINTTALCRSQFKILAFFATLTTVHSAVQKMPAPPSNGPKSPPIPGSRNP